MLTYTLLSFEDRWGADSNYEIALNAYFDMRRTGRPLNYPKGIAHIVADPYKQAAFADWQYEVVVK